MSAIPSPPGSPPQQQATRQVAATLLLALYTLVFLLKLDEKISPKGFASSFFLLLDNWTLEVLLFSLCFLLFQLES